VAQVAELLATLTDELRAANAFVVLLQQEQRLLTENETDQLLRLAEQKSSQAIKLNNLATHRRSLLERTIPDLSVNAIQTWLTDNSPEGLALWQQIRVLAEQSQQINHINGELIQMKLRHNQQSLATLSQAVHKADLYGPDGQRSFAPGSGRSLGSV